MKYTLLTVFLLFNAVALFCAINPWTTEWQRQGAAVLFFEAVFFLGIGIPVLLYQMIWRKKTFKQSVADSVETVLDFSLFRCMNMKDRLRAAVLTITVNI